MKKLTFLFVFFVLITYSCDKYDYPDIELTVNELYSYCATDGQHPCNDLLKHEGEFVTVIGYYRASSHEDNVKANKFRYFDQPTIGSINTEIKVLGDNKLVFDKISKLIQGNGTEEHIKLKVSGNIVGHDLPTNGACSRGVFLEIDSSDAIRAID